MLLFFPLTYSTRGSQLSTSDKILRIVKQKKKKNHVGFLTQVSMRSCPTLPGCVLRQKMMKPRVMAGEADHFMAARKQKGREEAREKILKVMTQ